MALLAEFFGGKPKVPNFNPVNAQTVQQQTLAGNTAALPETIAQTKAINLANMDEIDRMLSFASGGVYARMRDKNLSNIENLLNGGDITDIIRGTAAENLYRGVAGSGFGQTTALQNSVTATQANKAAGFSSLERWLAGVSNTYQPVSVAAMFARNTYDLPTALNHATEERNAQFQRDYVKNQWDWYGSFGQQWVRFEDSVVQLAGDVAGAAMACWVARECFGADNPKWILFRHWMLNIAPSWFRKLYLKHGERFAKWLRNKPVLKTIIRSWMESRIATLEVSYGPF